MKRRIKGLIILFLTFFIFKPSVSAGSLSIWASASNVTVGSKVTISVKAKSVAGTFNVTSSNNSILSGGTTGKWLEDDTYTFSFTAKSVGKATITVLAVDVADFDTNGGFSGAKSVTLNVVEKKQPSSSGTSGGTVNDKKEYSSDNTLKNLSVEGFELEEKFNKDTLEYKLTVDESQEKIKVNATPNHSKATVSGIGEKNLANGENTIEIKVVAENGNEKIYKLIVNVIDKNPITVKVGEEDYTIVKRNNNLIEPLAYYNEITLNIKDYEVIAYENVETKVTLMLLKDKDNKIDYYIFDKYNNTYTKYRDITVNGITIQLISPDYKLDNFKKYELELQDEKIDYYKIKGSHKVGLIYGTNVKTGHTGYFVYDKNEDTLSKYYDEEVKLYANEIKTLKSYIMFLIGGVSLVSIISIIVSLKKNKNKRNRYNLEGRY